jgi:DNA-binding response OmpR family regulator
MKRKAILVVEDDVTVRQVLTQALSDRDNWVAPPIEDGAQALVALDVVHPDLIVLDVTLPKLDGIAVYRKLREREDTTDVPVLFVTAASRRHDLAGPHGWLAKPFDIPEVLASAAELLGEEPRETPA